MPKTKTVTLKFREIAKPLADAALVVALQCFLVRSKGGLARDDSARIAKLNDLAGRILKELVEIQET